MAGDNGKVFLFEEADLKTVYNLSDLVAETETEIAHTIFIDDLHLSLNEIQSLLQKCLDSNAIRPDEIPS